MLYLSEFEYVKVYVGRCAPILLNPTLIETLGKFFSVKTLSSVKKDLETIFE